jgi:hypothetical protein
VINLESSGVEAPDWRPRHDKHYHGLGIYMISVTGDASAAAKVLRNGVEVPARVASNMYLTSIGYTVFVSPVNGPSSSHR